GSIFQKKNGKTRWRGRQSNKMSQEHSALFPDAWPAGPEAVTLERQDKRCGVWFCLGGETVLFTRLSGRYLAGNHSAAGRPSSDELFGLGLVFLMTMLLLVSSLTSVYAMYHMRSGDYKKMVLWLAITGLLGIGFLGAEIYEFAHYIIEYDFNFRSSAFGS